MAQIIHKDLVNITLANSFRNFGGALVEVFVPFLLLQQGLSLLQVCFFYVVYAAIKLCINFPSMLVTNRWGARTSLTIARLTYAGYLACLFFAEAQGNLDLIWFMPALLAFSNAFQWNAQHLHISRVIDMERKGKDIARIDAIDTFISTFAPLIAAGLALWLGAAWPLFIAIILILGSIFWLQHIDKEAGGHIRTNSMKYSLAYAPKRDLLANFAFNFHTATHGLIWPIYLALVLGSIGSIGLVVTVGSLIAIVCLLFVGNRSDASGTERVLREGSAAVFFVHLLRLLPPSVITVTLVNVFWRIAGLYQQNAWVSTYYAHTREGGINYIISMEIICDIAYIVLAIMLFVCIALFGNTVGFAVLFIAAAFVSLLCTLITPTKKQSLSSLHL